MNAPARAGTPRTIDVQAFIDGRPFSPRQWGVFVLCFTVVLLDGWRP